MANQASSAWLSSDTNSDESVDSLAETQTIPSLAFPRAEPGFWDVKIVEQKQAPGPRSDMNFLQLLIQVAHFADYFTQPPFIFGAI